MPFSLFPSLASPGQLAPDFTLLDHHGFSISLANYRAQSRGVILLFFASDFLPSDVAQLQAYSSAYPPLKASGLEILAVSGINWEKLHHLGQRFNIPFPLVFDPCCRYARQYGAMWVPRFLNGRAVFGILPNGEIHSAQHEASPETMLALFS